MNHAGEILLVVLPVLLGVATTGISYRAAFATGGAAFQLFEYDREDGRVVVPNIEGVRH